MNAKTCTLVLILVGAAAVGCVPDSACEAAQTEIADAASADELLQINAIPAQVSPGVGLQLTGTLSLDARIDQLIIGGTAAKGTSDNFATWEVSVPPSAFEGVEGRWSLTSKVQICGGELATLRTDLITVSVPSLKIELKPQNGECYIGANGSGIADIVVTSGAEFVGTKIVLTSPEGTAIYPSTTLFLESTGGAPPTTLFSTGRQEAVVAVAAAVGNRFTYSEPLRIAGPPVFDADPKAVGNGVRLGLSVSTRGRLDACIAHLPDGGAAEFSDGTALPNEVEVKAAGILVPPTTCGQQARIFALFDPGTIAGSTLSVACRDTQGQQTIRTVTSAGDQ